MGLSERQLQSLRALADALCPACQAPPNSGGEGASFPAFWATSAGEIPALVSKLEEAIETVLDEGERLEIGLLLTALSTAVGSALFIPCGPFTVAFSDRNLEERDAALKALSTSMLAPRRKAFNGLKRLILGLAASYTEDETDNTDAAATAATACSSRDGDSTPTGPRQIAGPQMNPFWEAVGYPGPPRLPADTRPETVAAAAAADSEALAGSKPADFLARSLSIQKDTELEYDAVVVGSGAGGGVAAAALATKGYSVLVLEKGKYFAPTEVSQLEEHGMKNMYEKSGLLTSTDGSIAILAGSTFGGGTSVNWACCLPTPDYVRREWAEKHGLEQFASPEFDTALAAVKERIGATAHGVVHNRVNTLMLDGCEKLRYKCDVAPQNLKDTSAVSAGWTCFGDRYGNKQGTCQTYLADAAAAGAQFVHECSVDNVLHAAAGNLRKATGVAARVGEFKLTVKARKCVIVSCGSLHSPCLLIRSGFKSDHIGRHLRLHPVTGVVAHYPGEEMNLWCGAPMTTVCKVAEMGPSGDGYGAKIEVPSAHVGLLGASCPWFGGEDFKRTMLHAEMKASLIVLQRDSGEGSVRLGPDGFSPKIDYIICDKDKESMCAAMKYCVRILAAGRPSEIMTLHSQRCKFEQARRICDGSGKNPAAEAELEKFLEKCDSLGIHENSVGLFSAHQMGSNRMGNDPSKSVVDENGEMWDCDNLFVADASVFPTASGANPMMTTLAISQMTMSRLANRLLHEDGKLNAGSSEFNAAVTMAEKRKVQRDRAAKKVIEKIVLRSQLVTAVAIGLIAVGIAYAWSLATASDLWGYSLQ